MGVIDDIRGQDGRIIKRESGAVEAAIEPFADFGIRIVIGVITPFPLSAFPIITMRIKQNIGNDPIFTIPRRKDSPTNGFAFEPIGLSFDDLCSIIENII